MWKRNQSMVSELSKSDLINKAIYINPVSSVKSFLFVKSDRHSATANTANKLLPVEINPRLFVYTPFTLFPNRALFMMLKKIEIRIFLEIIKKLNAGMPYIILINCPNILFNDLLDEVINKASLTVFDFSDDFLEIDYGKGTKNIFRKNTEKYAHIADLVLAVNEHTKRKYGSLNDNIHVVRNATNYDNFQREVYEPVDYLSTLQSNTIIGYSGIANTSRIDTGLLDYLAGKRPDWQFVFVGPASSGFKKKYSSAHNVHHLPAVHYSRLPDYIYYFDVAIVPFQINEHTKGNDLLKLHDYLAMGKPVVSTDIGGVGDFRDVVNVAGDRDEFIKYIELSLQNKNEELILKRRKVAMENSWQKRAGQVNELIMNAMQIKRDVLIRDN